MTIIKYNRNLKVVNTEQLPHGLNAPYLEVMESHIKDIFIAIRWRRTKTVSDRNNILIKF